MCHMSTFFINDHKFIKMIYPLLLRSLCILALLLVFIPTRPASAYGPKTWYVRPMGSDTAGTCSGLSNLDASNSPDCARASIPSAIASAADGDIILVTNTHVSYFMEIYGAININKAVHLILGEEVFFTQKKANTPCYIISVSHVRITGEANNPLCNTSTGSKAIYVNNGITDLTISGLRLSGTNAVSEAGIYFAGSIQNVQILTNTFSAFSKGNAVYFSELPSGVVDIEGNSFPSTEAGAVYLPASNAIDLRYNTWSSASGPGSTDISALHSSLGSAAATPFTYAYVKTTFDDAHEETSSAINGDTVIATISVDAVNLNGVDFYLNFPANILEFQSASTAGSDFGLGCTIDSNVASINTNGKIHFHGLANNYAVLTKTGALLYTITFKAIGNLQNGYIYGNGSSAAFSMAAGYGPSNAVIPNFDFKGIFVYPGSGTITGTVSMQGRIARDGATVTLQGVSTKSGLSVDKMVDNVNVENVMFTNDQLITISKAGYLSVNTGNNKKVNLRTIHTFQAIELFGGDANYNDIIDVNDANLIGADYGKTTLAVIQGSSNFTDINSSGKVDILDLALMGGNYDTTSSVAYQSWTP